MYVLYYKATSLHAAISVLPLLLPPRNPLGQERDESFRDLFRKGALLTCRASSTGSPHLSDFFGVVPASSTPYLHVSGFI